MMEASENASISPQTSPRRVEESDDAPKWYVMRDLKRSNAKLPAYKQLSDLDFEIFLPMKTVLATRRGRRVRLEQPFMQDLLFVHTGRAALDPIVERTPTLQYRFVRGAAYCTPMTVDTVEMERFIRAVRSTDSPQYYHISEITPSMYGSRIRIKDGLLNECEGHLMSVRGSRTKRLLLTVGELLAVSVEVSPEFIELL